jgi:hypothetical protein
MSATTSTKPGALTEENAIIEAANMADTTGHPVFVHYVADDATGGHWAAIPGTLADVRDAGVYFEEIAHVVLPGRAVFAYQRNAV